MKRLSPGGILAPFRHIPVRTVAGLLVAVPAGLYLGLALMGQDVGPTENWEKTILAYLFFQGLALVLWPLPRMRPVIRPFSRFLFGFMGLIELVLGMFGFLLSLIFMGTNVSIGVTMLPVALWLFFVGAVSRATLAADSAGGPPQSVPRQAPSQAPHGAYWHPAGSARPDTDGSYAATALRSGATGSPTARHDMTSGGGNAVALPSQAAPDSSAHPAAATGPGAVQRSEGRVPVFTRQAVPLERLAEELKKRIIGQDHVVDAVVKGLLRREAGLGGRERPFSALFAGPTGTGKTEFAKSLAQLLGRPLIRYDMNQFHDRYTASALVGAPPGYMGSDQPGRLVTDLASNPDALVLFDEIEKADARVLDPLLQLLDEGYARELSRGMIARAPEAILIFTTNLLHEAEWTCDSAVIRQLLVSRGMRPELVNRFTIVSFFRPFDRSTLREIARKTISDYLRAWAKNERLEGLTVQVEEEAVEAVLGVCDTRFGARDVQRAVENLLGDALADAYLPWKRGGQRPSRVSVRMEGASLVAQLDRSG